MWRYLAVILAIVAVVSVTGCKSSTNKAQIFKVQVDGKTTGFAATFTAYFPNAVQAHPGDTVEFTSIFTGEPHTVTLGKTVDAVFQLIPQACPNGGLADPNCQNGPPAQYADQYNALNAKLPQLLPNGPGDAIQAAAQPCFLTTGDAPADGSACSAAQQTQPAFDGTQTYYSSGFLPDQAVFSVKLADNVAPGTYNYYCLLHREGMSGTITVVAKATKVATPAEATKKGTDDLAALAAKLKPEFDKLASLKPDTASAGAFAEAVRDAEVNEFGPKEISIPVGGSATWTIHGGHTISFNAPTDASPLLSKGADGGYHLNQKGGTPAGGPGQTPPDPNAPPPDPNAPPTVIDAGSWDGQGFHSSGFIDAFQAPAAYKLTFTTAGTYKYVCLIHPDMEGTVKVGG